ALRLVGANDGERGAKHAVEFPQFAFEDAELALEDDALAVNQRHRGFGDATEHLLALDLKMAAHPCVPTRPWVIFGGIRRGLRGRRCVFDSLEYQISVGVGFAHGRSPNWLACLLGHEAIVRNTHVPEFFPRDAHGRRPSTILSNSLTTNSRNPSQRSRSNSSATFSWA